MDIESVKKLMELMDEHQLTHVEVSEGDKTICLAKETALPGAVVPAVAAVPATQPAAQPQAEPAAAEKPGEELKAPLVGIAYLAPSPDAQPFVQVGSKVKKGQTLCIVEAMKVMNEFTAPRDGEISDICVENEEMVEFGQTLFRLI